jgi:glycosyltransferase involved in cell wall biosynthesis
VQPQQTALFVGSWSYQKGADVLSKAIQKIDGIQLIHVGSLGDVPFPSDSRFVHHGPVAQWRLKSFYQAADVFVLASRQDGFGMVLSQALATGLPVVCTDRTGGPDLARVPGLGRLVRIVPAGDVEKLRLGLVEVLDIVRRQGLSIAEHEREMLSWHRYGIQHLQLITELAKANNRCETSI